MLSFSMVYGCQNRPENSKLMSLVLWSVFKISAVVLCPLPRSSVADYDYKITALFIIINSIVIRVVVLVHVLILGQSPQHRHQVRQPPTPPPLGT